MEDLLCRNKELSFENEMLGKENQELSELVIKMADFMDEQDIKLAELS
jgi:septal ring factor EnvC (AmiA/AmiB activator)